VLAVLNGETSTSVDSEGASISLNGIIDEALPPPPVTYQKAPRALVENTSSQEAFKSPTTYQPLCNAGNNCRSDGGVPYVRKCLPLIILCHISLPFRPDFLSFNDFNSQIWIAALSFQKYHGGVNINEFKQLFLQLSAEGLYQDEHLPGTAYFSLDNMESGNFDSGVLNALTTSLSDFIGNLFAREELLISPSTKTILRIKITNLMQKIFRI
jgi:hypothetical protein